MREKFEAVQVLRALAAGLVVFSHGIVNWAEKGAGNPGAIPNFPHMGDFGVKLFFCISGFIIVHTARHMPAGMDSAGTFLRRRLIRIVPLYWLITTIYVLKTVLTGASYSSAELIRSYAFVPYLNSHHLVQPILGQGWSLNYEMLFYVTFGALFFLPRRWHATAVAGLMTALAAARALGWLGDGTNPTALYHWADSVVLYFVLGVCICLLAAEWRKKELPSLSQNWAALLAAAIVLGFAFYALPANEGLAMVWMPVASAAPLALCVFARPEPCSVVLKPLVLAGDGSYSTYLAHGFFMGPLARLLGAAHLPIGFVGFGLLSLVACTYAGCVVHRHLERRLVQADWSVLRPTSIWMWLFPRA